MTTVRFTDVALLKEEHRTRKELIRRRLEEFASIPPERYFYELAYCLMTPQSTARNAAIVQRLLEDGDALHRSLPLVAILSGPDHYIRFHNTKARRIHEARDEYATIQAVIQSTDDAKSLRAQLVAGVKGLGWKEASHFLRNIGRRGLAILDRHILKNLVHHGVIESLPGALTSHRYLTIERDFQHFANSIGIDMDELDLLFWSRETGEILK